MKNSQASAIATPITHRPQIEKASPSSRGQKRIAFAYEAIEPCLAGFDLLIILTASIVGGAGYQFLNYDNWGQLQLYCAVGFASGLFYIYGARTAGLYQLTNVLSSQRILIQVGINWALAALLLMLFGFLFKLSADFSRGSVLCFLSLTFVGLAGWRLLAKRLLGRAMAHGMVQGRRCVLIGSYDELKFIDSPDLLGRYDLSEIARFLLPVAGGGNLSMAREEVASIDAAIEFARNNGAHEIVLALPWSEPRRVDLVRERLRLSPLPVQLLPDRCLRRVANNPSCSVKPTFAVELQRAPLSRTEQFKKRAFDLCLAASALLVLSPLMAVTALAIKLDSCGPVIFRQRRTGFGGKEFVIYKFRTMKVLEDGAAVTQARRVDARVTSIGRILRQSSIDELPQLINVIKGEMSLIGPRPHALAHDNQFQALISEYALRHHVKPGITGWAQVNGFRGETTRVEQIRARIEYDLWYINNWNIWLDLRILLHTCFEVMRRRNAY